MCLAAIAIRWSLWWYKNFIGVYASGRANYLLETKPNWSLSCIWVSLSLLILLKFCRLSDYLFSFWDFIHEHRRILNHIIVRNLRFLRKFVDCSFLIINNLTIVFIKNILYSLRLVLTRWWGKQWSDWEVILNFLYLAICFLKVETVFEVSRLQSPQLWSCWR